MLSVYFNWHDLAIWGVIAALTWRYHRAVAEWYYGCSAALLVFGAALPTTSSMIETEIIYARADSPSAIDSFNLWYTAFRYPVYWVLGIVWSAAVGTLSVRRTRAERAVAVDNDPLRHLTADR